MRARTPATLPTMLRWTSLTTVLLATVCEAFVFRSSVYRLSQGCWFASGRDVMSPLPHAVGGSSSVLRMGVDPEDLSDKRLFMEFNLFGFSGRTCQLELNANGDCVFSKGMVSKEPGAWRIEDEEGQEYLQFTCPLTELYSELFDIPSALLFARIPVRKGADGDFILEGGQIISERSSLLGLKKDPIDEGKFSARVMQEDEVFPETPIDFASVEIPKELLQFKKQQVGGSKGAGKGVATGLQVVEPPLPSDLTDDL